MDQDDPPSHASRPDETNPSTRVADDRDRISDDRDQIAEAHDKASDARDDRADARDERAEARDAAAARTDPGAAADRAGALRDRRGGASDRIQAADDRTAAAADRAVSARERQASSTDDLTGAYRRDAGTLEIGREIVRAKRAKEPVVLAFVDVDGLKERNDSRGHAAGDQLLCQTVETIRARLRPYDLIVRYGGDEFVCALANLGIDDATARFDAINSDLTQTQSASISVGLTELRHDDTVESVIARADEALYRRRSGDAPAG